MRTGGSARPTLTENRPAGLDRTIRLREDFPFARRTGRTLRDSLRDGSCDAASPVGEAVAARGGARPARSARGAGRGRPDRRRRPPAVQLLPDPVTHRHVPGHVTRLRHLRSVTVHQVGASGRIGIGASASRGRFPIVAYKFGCGRSSVITGLVRRLDRQPGSSGQYFVRSRRPPRARLGGQRWNRGATTHCTHQRSDWRSWTLTPAMTGKSVQDPKGSGDMSLLSSS